MAGKSKRSGVCEEVTLPPYMDDIAIRQQLRTEEKACSIEDRARFFLPGDNLTNDLMIMAAFRYCLGRQTYIVSTCISWLRDIWEDLQEGCQNTILRDIAQALMEDSAGSRMDWEAWQEFMMGRTGLLDGKPSEAQKKQLESVRVSLSWLNKPWPFQKPFPVYEAYRRSRI